MAKVSVIHNSGAKRKCEIVAFLHCHRCMDEKPDDVSPNDWARLSVGTTPHGIQVWCVRHNCNVDEMELKS